jgi:hypothetical protein
MKELADRDFCHAEKEFTLACQDRRRGPATEHDCITMSAPCPE